MQKPLNWLSEQTTAVKVAVGILSFAVFVIFLVWVGLWMLVPSVALWITAFGFVVALFIAVCIAFTILEDEL